MLSRLRRDIEATRDADLEALYDELSGYPGVTDEDDRAYARNPHDIMLVHELRLDEARLTFFSTMTKFGTARDLTLAEITIEAFYPANPSTAQALAIGVGAGQSD